MLRRAAQVTAVSNFLAREIGENVPGLRSEVRVTPMPLDVESFLQGRHGNKVQPPRILYAGNLVASKGVDVLLRAVAELRRRGIECARSRFWATAPRCVRFRGWPRELGIGSPVTWSGFVPQALMPGEYGASTVTVLPTRGNAEGLGLTLVEALLAGSAVVGTPAGGIPEVVQHERTGLIARDGDWNDLAGPDRAPPERRSASGALDRGREAACTAHLFTDGNDRSLSPDLR